MSIPKLIHQTYGESCLPERIIKNIKTLKEKNPQYEHCLYNDLDIHDFISKEYGSGMLKTYLSINPAYGAARADLFRYLLMYKLGGVYLDIKSTALKPLDSIIHPSDKFIICQWLNTAGKKYEGYGLHNELSNIPNGEYQQWNIIVEPNSVFMMSAIKHTLKNIKNYDIKSIGVGRKAVLLTTGPIMYTLAVNEYMHNSFHRTVSDNEKIGLLYSIYLPSEIHQLFPNHYTRSTEKLIL